MADVYDFEADQGTRLLMVISPAVEHLTSLAGYSARGQVRASRTLDGVPVLFDFAAYMTVDVANGQVLVDVPATQTADWDWIIPAQYDMELYDTDPAHDVRFIQGEIRISKEVTK